METGDGLDPADCAGIAHFHASRSGLLVTCDHMDLGRSVCGLGGVGLAHHFHAINPEPDHSRRIIDDAQTVATSWPNYHSGANGDFQVIVIVAPCHPVLADPAAPYGSIRYLPTHPHEGSVGVPAGSSGRVIARGVSKTTGRHFNLAVTFDPVDGSGSAIAESSFHHFADYNWDPSLGCPSFVTEVPGEALLNSPEARPSVETYISNLALWLGGRPVTELPAARRERKLDEALDESFPASDPQAVG